MLYAIIKHYLSVWSLERLDLRERKQARMEKRLLNRGLNTFWGRALCSVTAMLVKEGPETLVKKVHIEITPSIFFMMITGGVSKAWARIKGK